MIHVGDCLTIMRAMPENSVDAVVTDPPYGIRFMGKAWDGADIEARAHARRNWPSQYEGAGPNGGHNSLAAEAGKYDRSASASAAFQSFSEEWAIEALRVLKPGGYLLSFASPRTYHRMVCGIEDAGFEIRDCIQWVFGSGFPKSKNGVWGGTALKPAYEPIVVARKPMIGNHAMNYTVHGTGGLNIDGCRVETSDKLGGGDQSADTKVKTEGWNRPWMQDEAAKRAHAERMNASVAKAEALGRWPANLIHDGSDEVLDAFPEAPGQLASASASASARSSQNVYGAMKRGNGREGENSANSANNGAVGFAMRPGARRIDSGSAARFFYCAKASRDDRNDGLIDPGPQFKTGSMLRAAELLNAMPDRKGNTHPTVKPSDLMRYLCRLVTPAGGTVLDPFAGSGSTGRGAIAEGFQFIGIEIDPEYAAIAEARIKVVQPGFSFGAAHDHL